MLIAQVIVFDDNVMVRTPYVPSFVDALKYEIPSYGRAWDKPNRVWEVDPLYKNLAIDVCKRYFDVEIIDQTSRAQGQIQPSNPGDWADVLFDAMPERLHQQIYRSLVKALHPDMGGDTASMQILTEAYARRHK